MLTPYEGRLKPPANSTPYSRRFGSYYPRTSPLRSRVIDVFADRICKVGIPLGTGNLRQLWQHEATKLGVRAKSNFDWYMFWSAVCMRVILRLKKPKSLDNYIKLIHKYLYPEKTWRTKHPMKRSVFLTEIATYRELLLVRQITQELLVRASAFAVENEIDHPSWFNEMDTFNGVLRKAIKLVSPGIPLEIRYPLVDNGGNAVREEFTVQRQKREIGLEINSRTLSPNDARLLAYTLLSAAEFIESEEETVQIEEKTTGKPKRRI